MKILHRIISIGFVLTSLMFLVAAFALIAASALNFWNARELFTSGSAGLRLDPILESIGLLTIAVATFELSQTILEEEVLRGAHISAPTRVRRFLSRFMIVIVVSLSIEALVAVYHFVYEDPEHLPEAAMIGLAAAALLAAWGVFVRLNVAAEKLEPEAMEEAKQEDETVNEMKP